MTEKNNKKYEWVGDVDSYKEPEPNKHSVKYNEPNRDYDSDYKPTKEDIETFPDLQNGPSSLIQGSPVEIQQVGIHNFRLPLKYATRDKKVVELETKVTGTVSLEAHKKGINMSRIMRSFYEYKNDVFNINKLETVLEAYQAK